MTKARTVAGLVVGMFGNAAALVWCPGASAAAAVGAGYPVKRPARASWCFASRMRDRGAV